MILVDDTLNSEKVHDLTDENKYLLPRIDM